MKYLATPLLALTLALTLAPSANAQPASDWKTISGDVTFDDGWHLFELNRRTRKLRFSSWALNGSQGMHEAIYTVPAATLRRLGAALSKSKPDTRPYLLLRQGAQGDEVKALQAALSRSGFPVEIDGNFGAQTLNALSNYQEEHYLDVQPVLHTDAGEHLGLRGPLGDFRVDGEEGPRFYGGQLSSEIAGLLMSARRNAEPERTQLSGRIVKTQAGLELVTTPDATGKSKRYRLRGVHPKLDQTARVLSEVTLDAQVWQGEGRKPGVALFREIKVLVTPEQKPDRVKVGELVKVVGLSPPRTARNAQGKVEVVGGNDARVVAEDGTRGHLREPGRSAGPRAKKSGITAAIGGGGPR